MTKLATKHTPNAKTAADLDESENEAWLFKPENRKILEEVIKGLRQKGTIKRGSFKK